MTFALRHMPDVRKTNSSKHKFVLFYLKFTRRWFSIVGCDSKSFVFQIKILQKSSNCNLNDQYFSKLIFSKFIIPK